MKKRYELKVFSGYLSKGIYTNAVYTHILLYYACSNMSFLYDG